MSARRDSLQVEPHLPQGTEVVGGWGVGALRQARGPLQRCVGRNPRGADAPLDLIHYAGATEGWLQRFIDDVEQWGDAAGPPLLRVMAAGLGPRSDVAVRVLEPPRGVPLDALPVPMSVGMAVQLAGDVARALASAHARGLVHGELEASRIYVRDERAAIEPGGLRQALLASGAAAPDPSGPEVAPEVQQGRVQRGSDIYALGAILCRLLTGQPPVATAGGGMGAPAHVPLDPDVSHLLVACLQLDPARRPPAAEVVAQLVDLQQRFPADGPRPLDPVATPATVSRTVEPRLGMVDEVVTPAAPPAGDVRSVTPIDVRQSRPPTPAPMDLGVPTSAMVVMGAVLLLLILATATMLL
jgi:hypothetical protein